MIYKVLLKSIDADETTQLEDITNLVSTGFSVVEKLNEELDIGSMEITFSEKSTPYTMFDTIKIMLYNDTTEIYDKIYSMRIGGDNVQLVSKNPLIYSHSLSLVEHTKILERVVISGKTFTQPTDGSTPLSLYDVIKDIRDTQPLELDDLLVLTRIFTIPDEIKSYLELIESPEFTFKDVTLREALNQIVSYVNGVVRLDENNVLTIDFYNELVNLIAQETGNYNKTIQQNIQFYATDMTVDALNLVSDSDINEAVEVYPSENAWTTARSDQYIYDFTKSYITTPKRIYQVPKLIISGTVNVSDTNSPNSGSGAYNYNARYYYYAQNTEVFPVGKGEYDPAVYVDTDDSNATYYFDEATQLYVLDGSIQDPTTVLPRIVFYATNSDFPTTGVAYVTYISRETGLAYRYNSGYILLEHICSDGSVKIDLTPENKRLVEKNIYNTLDTDDTSVIPDRLDPSTYYKSNTLYYTYRENNIPIGSTFGIFDTQTSLEFIIGIRCFELLQEDGIVSASSAYTDVTTSLINVIDDTMFRVYYVPIPKSTRFNIDRQDITDVYKKSTLISNQQSRIVNTSNFLNNIEARINKIGNSELMLYNRVSSIDDVYNISDYTEENYVLTNKEVIFFKDFIDCSYELSRNWNMLSQFISVNSEIRQWEMGEQNTLQRNLLYKEFVEIDVVNSGNGGNSSEWVQEDGVKCFMDTFNISSTYEPIRNSILDSSETTNDLICGMSSVGGGNNLLFNFQFDSNAYVGNYLEELSSQTANQYANYTDTDGKMESGTFYLYDEFNEETRYETLRELANLYPQTDKSYIKTTLLKNNSELIIKKDNREEIGLTLQLQLINTDIQTNVLGRALSNKNRLVNESSPSTIRLYVYESSSFGKNDNTKAPSGHTGVLTPTLAFDYANSKITVTNASLTSSIQSWCLTDENDNILIAVNQDGTLLNVITFSFNNKKTGVLAFGIGMVIELEAFNTAIANCEMILIQRFDYYLDALSSATASTEMIYTQGLNFEADLMSTAIGSTEMEYIKSLNIGFAGMSTAIGTNEIEYSQILNYNLDGSSTAIVNTEMIFTPTVYSELDAQSTVNASNEMIYTTTLPVYWTVRYLDWDGTLISTQQVLDGGDAGLPQPPDRPHYTFDGWDRDKYNITEDTDITAIYSIDTFTVEFINEGSTYDTQEVDYGDDADTPTPNPTKATDSTYDYTFDSWDTDYTNVTEDLTVTAVYNATVRTDVSWQEVTSGTPTTNQCINIYDVGNIKEEASCTFTGGTAYQSQTSLTTPIPPCSDGATYTLCVKISSVPLLFSCVDYEGVEGTPVLYECQID